MMVDVFGVCCIGVYCWVGEFFLYLVMFVD